MSKTRITCEEVEDAWMEAGAAAGVIRQYDQDAMTTDELRKRWKCGEKKARRAAKDLVAQGIFEECRKMIQRGDGTQYPSIAYRLVKKGKK